LSWGNFGEKKSKKADFVEAFLLRIKNPFLFHPKFGSMEFTILITETTGLSIKDDYILIRGSKIQVNEYDRNQALELIQNLQNLGQKPLQFIA